MSNREKRIDTSTKNYREAWFKNLSTQVLYQNEKVLLGDRHYMPADLEEKVLQRIKQIEPILGQIRWIRNANYSIDIAFIDENEEFNFTKLITKSIASYVKASPNIKTSSPEEVESFLIEVMADSLAKKLVKQVAIGAGSATELSGIIHGGSGNLGEYVEGVDLFTATTVESQSTMIYNWLLSVRYTPTNRVMMNYKTLLDLKPRTDEYVRWNNEQGRVFFENIPVEIMPDLSDGEIYLGSLSNYVFKQLSPLEALFTTSTSYREGALDYSLRILADGSCATGLKNFSKLVLA